MEFDQIKAEVYSYGGDYLDDGDEGSARVGRWVNQAYRELCDLAAWPFLRTVASGAAPLTVADLGFPIISVMQGTIRLEQTEEHVLTERVENLARTGSPLFFYVTGGTVLNVYPVNTGSITVTYLKRVAALANVNDEPIVPSAYHDIIVLGAVRRLLVDDHSPDAAAVAAEYAERVSVMRQALLQAPTRQQIVTGAGDW